MGCQGTWKQCQGELRQDCQPQVWWRGRSCVWRRMYSCWKCRNDVPQCSKPGSQGTCQENCQGNRKKRCQECDCWRQGKKEVCHGNPVIQLNLKLPLKML